MCSRRCGVQCCPWPSGLTLTAGRGSTPSWSRAQVVTWYTDQGRATLAERRSQKKRHLRRMCAPSHLRSSLTPQIISSHRRHICASSLFQIFTSSLSPSGLHTLKPHLVFTSSDLHHVVALSYLVIFKISSCSSYYNFTTWYMYVFKTSSPRPRANHRLVSWLDWFFSFRSFFCITFFFLVRVEATGWLFSCGLLCCCSCCGSWLLWLLLLLRQTRLWPVPKGVILAFWKIYLGSKTVQHPVSESRVQSMPGLGFAAVLT